jgi:MSHA biogenesis protein MshI
VLDLFKKKTTGERLIVVFGEGRVDLVRIVRRDGEKPAVVMAESVLRGEDDIATLVALRKPMALDRYVCSTLLTEGQYQLIQTDAPDASLPVTEVREALRWKMKDVVSFPVDAAAVDYVSLPASRSPQVLVALADENAVRTLVQNFQAAKVELDTIDLPEFSQRNIATLFAEADRGQAVLIFDDVEGMLSFSSGGELCVVRHIEIPARNLATSDPERRANLYERIALDLQRSLDNFDRSFSNVPLAKLLVAPVPGAEGFLDYLRANLLMPVEALDITSRLDISATPALLDPLRQAQMMRALGAALREESKV